MKRQFVAQKMHGDVPVFGGKKTRHRKGGAFAGFSTAIAAAGGRKSRRRKSRRRKGGNQPYVNVY